MALLRSLASAGALALLAAACAPTAPAPPPTPATAATRPPASPPPSPSPAARPPVSPAPSPVATPSSAPPSMAPPSLRITGVQVTAGDASMTLQNTGSTEVDLSNWEVRVGTSTVRLPANTRLGPADTLTLHSSAGSSSGRDVYLGQGAAALVSGLQPGARVSLLDSHGNLVTEFSVPGS